MVIGTTMTQMEISKLVGFLMVVENTTYIQTVLWQKVGYLPMDIINT